MGVGIGEAVEALKRGQAVRRSEWNGIWVAMARGPAVTLPFRSAVVMAEYFVVMKTATGELVPWPCSQTDLLASDWEVVPEGERTA